MSGNESITFEEESAQVSTQSSLTGRRLLAEVARRYYLRDEAKKDIAEAMGLSRFKVARLLTQARANGVVTITVEAVAPVIESLSTELSAHWRIPTTVVDSGAGREAEVRQAIGVAAAERLTNSLRDGDLVGLAWGRSLTAMA
ncbi:MAG: hypothetical protein LBH68_07180, partial [Bifidobacteriaceae bacterium]|nr:hypothetical protein [Bifidobacteriaceae bacterium]